MRILLSDSQQTWPIYKFCFFSQWARIQLSFRFWLSTGVQYKPAAAAYPPQQLHPKSSSSQHRKTSSLFDERDTKRSAGPHHYRTNRGDTIIFISNHFRQESCLLILPSPQLENFPASVSKFPPKGKRGFRIRNRMCKVLWEGNLPFHTLRSRDRQRFLVPPSNNCQWQESRHMYP